MADKLMYNTNYNAQNYPFVDYNQWLKRLDAQLDESTNKNSIKVHKVVEPTNKKTLKYN